MATKLALHIYCAFDIYAVVVGLQICLNLGSSSTSWRDTVVQFLGRVVSSQILSLFSSLLQFFQSLKIDSTAKVFLLLRNINLKVFQIFNTFSTNNSNDKTAETQLCFVSLLFLCCFCRPPWINNKLSAVRINELFTHDVTTTPSRFRTGQSRKHSPNVEIDENCIDDIFWNLDNFFAIWFWKYLFSCHYNVTKLPINHHQNNSAEILIIALIWVWVLD